MTRSQAKFQTGVDVLDSWRVSVLTGAAPVLYPVGSGELSRIEVGPRLVTLIGGLPGGGKTALTMQLSVDALRLTPELRTLVCNVEMPPAVLLDRQLARISGVDATTIRYRKIGAEHAERVDQAMHTLEPLAERIAFVQPPFDLENIAHSADAFDASLLVLDYIQRIHPPGEHGDRRGSVDASMSYLGQFADAGVAVLVVAALARSKDKRGRSSYTAEGLSLASFRESSELEYGADDAYLLVPDDDGLVRLRHEKSWHGETRDVVLTFDKSLQRFAPAPETAVSRPAEPDRKLRSTLKAPWARTEPAGDDGDGENGDE